MSRASTFKRAIWAVDPFAEDVELQRKTLQTLMTVTGPREGVIEPVSLVLWENRYVIGKKEVTLPEYTTNVANKVREIGKRFGAKGLCEPKVIVQESYSLALAVQRLLDYAGKENTDLIALGTQAREGTTRFLLGSFAESLILSSAIPTLVVSPRTEPLANVRNILFPTDFSDEAKLGFHQATAFARETGAKLTLFHVHPGSDFEGLEEPMKKLTTSARERGIEVDGIFKVAGESIAESILALAGESPSTIIAMISKKHPSGKILVGDVTRQVLRRALSPVWVLHPGKK